MRKVLIFSSVFYPQFVGGAEIAVKEITDRISSEDISFDMVTLRMDSKLPKFEKIGNINVYRIGWAADLKRVEVLPRWINLNKYFFLITGLRKAISLNRRERYSAVWSIMASYNSFAAVLFKYLNPKVKFLLTLQEGDPLEYIEKRARPLWPLFKKIFQKADHIQAISKFLADWAKKMGAKCPVEVVPNAVDFELFEKRISDREIESLKQKMGKKDGDIFLITTSRLVKKNAIGDVIEAMRFLPSNIKFLILGKGELEEGLKQKAADLHLVDRVTFMGYIPHKEMPQFLQISDIFIRPALSEGLGNSFLEAMAAKIPVIATPVGGIPDFLIDGETGLFCEPGNSRSIAQKIEKLIKDEQSRDYIVARAFDMVSKKYRWDQISAQIKHIFLHLFTDR